MKLGGMYNPASTELPNDWDTKIDRKTVLERPLSAIVGRINKAVYCDRGYEISEDECNNLLNTKVTLIIYDNVTGYFQTTEYLWIYRECLDIEKEEKEDIQFGIAFNNVPDEMIDHNINPCERLIILQCVKMLIASYNLFLRNVKSMFDYNMAMPLEKQMKRKYVRGMHYFLTSLQTEFGTSHPDDIIRHIYSVMTSDDVSVTLIKPTYLIGVFVQWSCRMDEAAKIIGENKSSFDRLHVMHVAINANDIYYEAIDELVSSIFSIVMDKPDESFDLEALRLKDIRDTIKESISKLSSEYMSYYNSAEK